MFLYLFLCEADYQPARDAVCLLQEAGGAGDAEWSEARVSGTGSAFACVLFADVWPPVAAAARDVCRLPCLLSLRAQDREMLATMYRLVKSGPRRALRELDVAEPVEHRMCGACSAEHARDVLKSAHARAASAAAGSTEDAYLRAVQRVAIDRLCSSMKCQPSTTQLALDLWRRVSEEGASVAAAAACAWIASKIVEIWPLPGWKVCMRFGVEREQLLEEEVGVMRRLRWRPLEGWVD